VLLIARRYPMLFCISEDRVASNFEQMQGTFASWLSDERARPAAPCLPLPPPPLPLHDAAASVCLVPGAGVCVCVCRAAAC
jgi:hypothetical protein